MVTYKSGGGKGRTPAEYRLGAVKALLIFLVVVGVTLGAALYLQGKDFGNRETANPTAAQCGNIVENSVFSTGSPLTDQRLLWVIINDQSENKSVAGGIVDHVWKHENFKFEDDAQQRMWNEAVEKVKNIRSPISKPALSITSAGVITPFSAPPETNSIIWTEVSVGTAPDNRSNFLMVSAVNETSSTAVPTVLLSINGGNVVPSPTLGQNATHTVVDIKKVCEQ